MSESRETLYLDDYSHGGISTHNTEPQIWLEGNNGTFSDNVVHNSTGGQWLLWLGWFYDGQRADGWTITGNTFRELRAAAHGHGSRCHQLHHHQ